MEGAAGVCAAFEKEKSKGGLYRPPEWIMIEEMCTKKGSKDE